jgi:integrase
MAQTWMDSRGHLASNYDERNRWKNHLAPALGHLTPDQVTVSVLKRLIQDLREKGLAPGTIGLQIALLSSFWSDLVEDGTATVNPVKMLSRKTRKNELTSDQDWKKTPFLRDIKDVVRVHDRLAHYDERIAIAYIIGALAGLRTGEVRALRWEHVNLETRLIHVQDKVGRRSGKVETPKDDESRFVPITDALYWYLRSAMPRFPTCSSTTTGWGRTSPRSWPSWSCRRCAGTRAHATPSPRNGSSTAALWRPFGR